MRERLPWPCAAFAVLANAAVPQDLVSSLPGFEAAPFKVYSGMLEVPGPFAGHADRLAPPMYDALRVHYHLELSQRGLKTDAVVAWHNGGPGSSSVVGAFFEMGYHQVDADGRFEVNAWAWNRMANMLYLESPAGSGHASGFSQCLQAGRPVACRWDDSTQAVAYAHTLLAFYAAYPELAHRDLYLAGESYFGQYGPHIASYILNNKTIDAAIPLKGMLVGNGCWGGADLCNGPHEAEHTLQFYHGHGLFRSKLYKDILAECDFASGNFSQRCSALYLQSISAVGPHTVYNIYDDCAAPAALLANIPGSSQASLLQELRESLHDPPPMRERLERLSGGFGYSCRSDDSVSAYLIRDDVRKALHLPKPGQSQFSYALTGAAAVDLYPSLARRLRILIYSGDADACVPMPSTQEFLSVLEDKAVIEETSPWSPWFASPHASAPAGYETRYAVNGTESFVFRSVRLAGHMVPYYMPEAAFAMFSDFVDVKMTAEARLV